MPVIQWQPATHYPFIMAAQGKLREGVHVLGQLLIRFLVGGLFVSAFAVFGTVLKPRSFAGLFGAAPSVGLATLALTITTEGKAYAAVEARSMLGGAAAFLVYAWCAMVLLYRYKPPAKIFTSLLLFLWLAVALTLWFYFFKAGV
jgi:hypothetical protein